MSGRRSAASRGSRAPGGGARARRRGARKATLSLLGALLVGLAGLGAYRLLFAPRASLDALPNPDLSAVEPQVAEKIRSLRGAVVRDPGSAAAWGKLGMTLDVHGFDREAVSAYQQAGALDRGDFRWPYFHAIALQETGSSEAIAVFEASRGRRPDYPPLYLRLGEALFDAGELTGSEEAFRRALELDPSLSQAYLGLGRIALANGDPEASRAELRRAVEIDPAYGAAWTLLAEVHRRLGETAAAEETALRAGQLPERPVFTDSVYAAVLKEGVSARWYIVRGEAFLDRGRTEEAERLFRAALAIRADANAHDNLGLALQFQGRFEEAAEQHRAALEIRPGFREAQVNLGSALYRLGQIDEAIAAAERARDLDPAFAQAYLNLGLYLARAGRRREAIQTFRHGLARAPFDVRIANQLAWLLATSTDSTLRDGAEAVRLAERVSEMTAFQVPDVLDVLAAAYAETRAFERAVETARRARRLAAGTGRTELAAEIERRLERYEAKRPYRSSGFQE
ncbi:MAG: tetratricopeptide repeat protein [Gemmatimonadota bacterium]